MLCELSKEKKFEVDARWMGKICRRFKSSQPSPFRPSQEREPGNQNFLINFLPFQINGCSKYDLLLLEKKKNAIY